MEPGRYDWKIWRGNSEEVTFKFWQDRAKTTPLDLTGSELHFKLTHGGGEIVKSSVAASLVVNALAGEVAVELTPAETRAITTTTFVPVYELERRIGGKQKTLIWGEVKSTGGRNND